MLASICIHVSIDQATPGRPAYHSIILMLIVIGGLFLVLCSLWELRWTRIQVLIALQRLHHTVFLLSEATRKTV